jgi:hypothetical protein
MQAGASEAIPRIDSWARMRCSLSIDHSIPHSGGGEAPALSTAWLRMLVRAARLAAQKADSLNAFTIAQVIQQLFRRDKIGGTKALREAAVDRLEAGDGVGGAALRAHRVGEARRSTQLP